MVLRAILWSAAVVAAACGVTMCTAAKLGADSERRLEKMKKRE